MRRALRRGSGAGSGRLGLILAGLLAGCLCSGSRTDIPYLASGSCGPGGRVTLSLIPADSSMYDSMCHVPRLSDPAVLGLSPRTTVLGGMNVKDYRQGGWTLHDVRPVPTPTDAGAADAGATADAGAVDAGTADGGFPMMRDDEIECRTTLVGEGMLRLSCMRLICTQLDPNHAECRGEPLCESLLTETK